MRTQEIQVRSRRQRFASLVLVIAVVTWGTQMAESAEGRRRRADFRDVDIMRDLVYKRVDGHNLQLDIYSPKSISHPLPVVLWIHGHRWALRKQRTATALSTSWRRVISLSAWTIGSQGRRLFRRQSKTARPRSVGCAPMLPLTTSIPITSAPGAILRGTSGCASRYLGWCCGVGGRRR